MARPSITDDLIDFVNMAQNPVRFDPISYVDRTQGWIDFPIALDQLRVSGFVNKTLEFGEGKEKKTRTERYAQLVINSEKEGIGDKTWKVYNRVASELRSRGSPAFSQLCNKVRDVTGVTATEFKAMVTPRKSHKDENGKWVFTTDTNLAVRTLNQGLSKTEDEWTLRLNPNQDKVEAFVSDKYAPITNKEILTFLQGEIGDFDIVREFHDDRRSLFQVLPEKFSGLSDSEEYGLFIENSSSGNNRVGMGMFVITMVCTNGLMVVSSKYGETEYLKRKHFGDKEEIMDLIQSQCALMSERIKDINLKIERAKTIPLRGAEHSMEDVSEYLLKPLAEAKNFSKPTVDRIEKLLNEKYQHDSVWDFISALTDAAHEAPANTREHIEKVAGEMLELLVPA